MFDRQWMDARDRRLTAEMVARQDRLDVEEEARHERAEARARATLRAAVWDQYGFHRA